MSRVSETRKNRHELGTQTYQRSPLPEMPPNRVMHWHGKDERVSVESEPYPVDATGVSIGTSVAHTHGDISNARIGDQSGCTLRQDLRMDVGVADHVVTLR